MSTIITAVFSLCYKTLLYQEHRQTVAVSTKGATTGGSEGPDPPKFGRTTPTFYAAADCSARNWVYHPYFVLYNNLNRGIGPPTLKTWFRPWFLPVIDITSALSAFASDIQHV